MHLPFPATHQQPKTTRVPGKTYSQSCVGEHTYHSFALAHLTCFSELLPRSGYHCISFSYGRKLPQQDRSPFSTYLTDRLRFKRTAILPLPSLEAVNCQASEKIFWGNIDIITHLIYPSPSPSPSPSALCDSAPGLQPPLMNSWH